MAINFAPGTLQRSLPSFNPVAAWTVAWWCRPHTDAPTTGQYRQYFTHSGNGGTNWIWCGSYDDFGGNSIGFEIGDNDEYYDFSIVALPLGAWAHITVTYDPVTHAISFYKDRTLVSAPYIFDLAGLDDGWTANEWVADHWGNWNMAQLRLWQAALTQAELVAEAASVTAVRRANLLADTPLPTSADVTDYSGNGNHWTPFGSISTAPTSPPLPLIIRVSDAVSTRELRPAEPPRPTRQVALPSGYQLPQSAPAVPPYTEYYNNQLYYGGPWPLFFTSCFWVQNLTDYIIRSQYGVINNPNPFNQISLWRNDAQSYFGMAVTLGDPSGNADIEVILPVTAVHDWHHIALLRDGPDTFISLDNQPWRQAISPATGTPWFDEWFATNLQGGLNAQNVYPRVAYYRMWSAALGLNELRQEARARQAVRTANLWRDTPLEGAAVDISGNSRHWVVGVGGLVVPSYGDGPLPWVADPVRTRDASGVTAQSPSTRQAASLLSATDGLFVSGQRDLPVAEPMAVSELAAVAVARPVATTNRQKRWYTQNQTGAGFTPSGLRGPWTAFRDGGALTASRLDPPAQLVTAPFNISATQGNRTIAGTASTTVCCGIYVTDPLPAQIITGVFNLCQYVIDSLAQFTFRPRRFKLYAYVTVGNTNTVRGVLLDYTAPASTGNHWPYPLGGSYRWWQLEAATTLTPVTLLAGDRVVVELGFASDAAWGSAQIGYSFSGNGMQNDPTPNAPGDNVSPNVQWTPGKNTIFSNSWVEFTPGVLVTPHGVKLYDYVTTLETRKALISKSVLRLADVIAVADRVDGPQTGRDLYVRPAEVITVVDRVRRPIYLVVWEKPFSNIAVQENVTRRLGPPVTVQSRTPSETLAVADVVTPLRLAALSVRPFEALTVNAVAGIEVPITFPPYIPTVGPGIGVFDTIRVRDERLRQVNSSKLEVRASDYVRTIDPLLPVLYGTFWDGTSTPPAPTPGVFDDYWLVGV